MSIDITKPVERPDVIIGLSYESAEVLWRVLGNLNYGNSQKYPEIAELSDALLAEFGRDDMDGGSKYYSTIQAGQVYVQEIDREHW